MTGSSAPPGTPAGPPLGWLLEVVRPRKEAIPWSQMTRSALAVCVPLAVGLAAGEQVYGLLIAIGGLLASVVDRGGPYLLRLRRIGAAGVFGGAAGLTIGGLIHGRGWVAVVVLVLIAGLSAVLSAAGGTASITCLQLLVYASFGTGPLGGLRPLWLTPLLFLAGVGWAVLLMIPGWVLAPRAAEQRLVAGVYRALARSLRSAGTGDFAADRRALTAALNAAYDELLTLRSQAGGHESRLTALMAVLNQAHLITEAATAFAEEGRRPPGRVADAVEALAETVQHGGPVPPIPDLPSGAAASDQALHEGLSNAADLVAGRAKPDSGTRSRYAARRRAQLRQRLGVSLDEIRNGSLIRVFAVRLMLCIGVAAVLSEVLPLQRSYWVILTVAIVLKPDMGSVFARALQRGIGTVVGAVAGALILAVVPDGPLLLIPMAVFAALLPYGRNRNYGMLATFLTPLVVLLIDLLDKGGWRLAGTRLADTLLGCGIVLLIGYAPWPMAWYAHLPRQYASAAEKVAVYVQRALTAGPPATAARAPLRRQAYRALSDLRTDFQRTMSEPPPVRRRAAAWWPAVVALEQIMDAVTAAGVSIDHGSPPPPPDAVAVLACGLRQVAAAVRDAQHAPDPATLPDTSMLRPAAQPAR